MRAVRAAQPAFARDLLVFAAASLKEPLDQIAAELGGVTVSYGGSGILARQVVQGAPADIVLLANADWMDVLEAEGQVAQRVDFASNALVVVGAEPGTVALTAAAFDAALGDGPLAMGFVTSVPAGIYGRAALDDLGLWDGVAARVAQVDNVRAALALVARGEAPLGVVYQSDVAVVPTLSVVARIPSMHHPKIRYVGAVTASATHPKARTFLQNLTSPSGQAVLQAAGFCPVVGC